MQWLDYHVAAADTADVMHVHIGSGSNQNSVHVAGRLISPTTTASLSRAGFAMETTRSRADLG